MRKFINQYGYIIAIAAVVIAAIVAFMSMRGTTAPSMPQRAFYIDEETGEETTGEIDGIPPLANKNGKLTLVKALKYTCDGGKTKTTYLLIKYPPAVQNEIQSLNKDDPVADLRRVKLIEEGYWVRSPAKESQWVPSMSPKGVELMSMPTCPDGKAAQIVFP